MAATPWDSELARELKDRFGDRLVKLSTYLGQNFIVAKPEAAISVLEYLKLRKEPIDVLHLLDKRVGGDAALGSFGRAQADAGEFRVGVGTPGNHKCAHLRPAEKQGILQDQSGHCIGGMGEFEARTDIARRVDVWIAGA